MNDIAQTAKPNYEAMYNEAMQELKKANEKIQWMEREAEQSENERLYLSGFKTAVEIIFERAGRK